jgi:pimeloyl-ACP methyl ester carboxylesterase
MKKIIGGLVAAAILLFSAGPAAAATIESGKYAIPSPSPVDQLPGAVTPDGTFNVRDPNAPFHSDRLADAMWLDSEGRHPNGEYLNLNRAIYTAYRLSSDQDQPDTILILMPGFGAGAMTIDRLARDVLRVADHHQRKGLQVWLIDRRSEQLEDHTALWWAERNKDDLAINELFEGLFDYYRPAFFPEDPGRELMGRRFTPLDKDAARFVANWGADMTVRDFRAVVLEAHRKVGNKVIGTEVDDAVVEKKPGRFVFIGGHSMGGYLTRLYASYDFDRRPGHEVLGMDDVDGLIILEGGGFKHREIKEIDADKYRESLQKYFEEGAPYLEMNMLSAAIMGWAAYNARGMESVFPDYLVMMTARMPRMTNEAVLGYGMDDDVTPMFIGRVSMGFPSGEMGMGGQLRRKLAQLPLDPGECPVITPWYPGHRVKDNPLRPSCVRDCEEAPEVTDFYDFARSFYAGPPEYENEEWLSRGPNDFAEWYFPARLGTEARNVGTMIVDRDQGLELLNGTHLKDISLPVISFTGDDSMGEFLAPELNEKNFTRGMLGHEATAVHILRGYTHLDITAATRNNQPELAGEWEDYNGPAVYAYRFIEQISE